MALYVTKDLEALVLAKNPASLTAVKTGIVTTAGVKSSAVFSWTNDGSPVRPNNNDTFVWSWGASDPIVWTFKSGVSTLTDLQIYNYAGYLVYVNPAGTFITWGQYVADRLMAYVPFGDLFKVEVLALSTITRVYFRITAKNYGTDYSLQVGSGAGVVAYKEGTVTPTAGVDVETLSNYRMNLRLYMEDSADSGTYSLIQTQEAVGQIDYSLNQMVVTFHDVNAALYKMLMPELPVNAYKPFRCTKNYRRFYYELYDESGDIPEPGLKLTSAVKTAILAGFDLEHFDYADYIGYYYSTSPSRRFLTNHPGQKLIRKDAIEWLGTMVTAADLALAGSFKLRAITRYTDGSSVTYNAALTDITKAGLWLLPAGWQQCKASSTASGKTPLSYTLQFGKLNGSSWTAISEQREFIMEYRSFAWERNLLFYNSLGGWDSLRCTGLISTSLADRKQDQQSIISRDSRMEDGTMRMTYTSDSDIINGSTGYISKAEQTKWLNDFRITLKAVELFGGLPADTTPAEMVRWKNIWLKADKTPINKDLDYLWQMEFEYTYAWEDVNFTNADVLAKLIPGSSTSGKKMTVKSLGAGSPSMSVTIYGTDPVFKLAGTEQSVSSSGSGYKVYTQAITAPGMMDLDISGDDITKIKIELTDQEDTDISISSIACPSLTHLWIRDVRYVRTDWLIDNILSLPALQEIRIKGVETGEELDNLIFALAKLRNTYGVLSYIVLDGSINPAPGALASATITYLTGLGLTIDHN